LLVRYAVEIRRGRVAAQERTEAAHLDLKPGVVGVLDTRPGRESIYLILLKPRKQVAIRLSALVVLVQLRRLGGSPCRGEVWRVRCRGGACLALC
jgi:hypothetical protein